MNILSDSRIVVIAGAQELKYANIQQEQRIDSVPSQSNSNFGLIPMLYYLTRVESESTHWLLESIPMRFESGIEIFIDTEEFLHKAFVYLDRIYVIYYSQNNLENSTLIVDPEQKCIFRVDLETQPEIVRTNYSIAGDDNCKLYIFGGVNPEGDATNSLEVFDAAQYKWQKIETRGNPPSPRQGHSAIIVDNNMFVFGGTEDTDKDDPKPCEQSVAILNLDLHEWLNVGEMSGAVPSNMIFHHTHLIDEQKDRILICWKSAKNSKLRMSIFHIANKEWITVNMQFAPDFRVGAGSIIISYPEVTGQKAKNQDSEMADEIKKPKKQKSTLKVPTKLLILGGYEENDNKYLHLDELDINNGELKMGKKKKGSKKAVKETGIYLSLD
jgi:hypothetical protein